MTGGTVRVHIGTHKTGTTSLQRWLQANSSLLSPGGTGVFRGMFGPNHFEVALLAVDADRTLPVHRRVVESRLPEWRADAAAHVQQQVSRPERDLIVSSEALSLLRTTDELERVVQLFAPRRVEIVVCLRERASFLRSYRAMVDSPSPYPSSHAYVEDDTWLVDWDEMILGWQQMVGERAVHVISYETALEEDGSTIPAVLEALGVDPAPLPTRHARFYNRTVSPVSRAGRAKRAVSGLFRGGSSG